MLEKQMINLFFQNGIMEILELYFGIKKNFMWVISLLISFNFQRKIPF